MEWYEEVCEGLTESQPLAPSCYQPLCVNSKQSLFVLFFFFFFFFFPILPAPLRISNLPPGTAHFAAIFSPCGQFIAIGANDGNTSAGGGGEKIDEIHIKKKAGETPHYSPSSLII